MNNAKWTATCFRITASAPSVQQQCGHHEGHTPRRTWSRACGVFRAYDEFPIPGLDPHHYGQVGGAAAEWTARLELRWRHDCALATAHSLHVDCTSIGKQEGTMAIKAVWCPVLQAHVTCVTDLEGTVVTVVCHEYNKATRACRMKQAAMRGGPLSQLLARVSENALADPMVNCTIG
jgi:hypothetical protein